MEDFIKNIEESKILKDDNFEDRKDNLNLPSIIEFMNYFDDHMNRVVNENVEKYQLITEFMTKIEETIFST
jgi:hypothetical protein